jgi:hypothetical protein
MPSFAAGSLNLPRHPRVMLTEIYIEALLVDKELVDRVWEALNAGEIGDADATLAWLGVVHSGPTQGR